MVFPNRPRRATDPAQVEADIMKGLDDVAQSLRWAKHHLHERRTPDQLRLVQLNLNYLSLAIDWQMEGDVTKADQAIDRVWWQPQKED